MMVHIKQVGPPDEKTAITKKIMHSLPEWFSPPEDIDKKAIMHMEQPFFAAYDGDAPIGFITLKIHNQYAADIFNLGVLEQFHRQGVGRRLLEAAEQYCRNCSYLYLTVKTLDSSAEYEPYERTRAFYRKMGFVPLEVFATFWNEENPCLFMVKRLSGENVDDKYDSAFWQALDKLVAESKIVIDRPKNSLHPKYPKLIYPVDYGCLENTSSMEGGGIDVWKGTDGDAVDAIICTVDLLKRDSEMKIRIGCSEDEKRLVLEMHNNSEYMNGVLIRRA
jgi:ribosomal protein S18 acetylase RimI-like enzyme